MKARFEMMSEENVLRGTFDDVVMYIGRGAGKSWEDQDDAEHRLKKDVKNRLSDYPEIDIGSHVTLYGRKCVIIGTRSRDGKYELLAKPHENASEMP